MSLRHLNWIPICCAEWPEYAEAPTRDGGLARVYRDPRKPGEYKVCRFGPDNKPIDADGDGVPDYVEMAEADAVALLAPMR